MTNKFSESAFESPELEAYDEDLRRAIALYRGHLDRPTLAIGIKPRPQFCRDEEGRRGDCEIRPIRREQLLLDPQQIQVVLMSRVPRHEWRHARYLRFHTVLAEFEWGKEGPAVGASRRSILDSWNFARRPMPDTQILETCEGPGPLVCEWPEGRFQVRESAQYLDLCVGGLHRSRQPAIHYRLLAADREQVTLTAEAGTRVRQGDTLAVLQTPLSYAKAQCDEQGPCIHYVRGEIFPASRKTELFRLLNRLNQLQYRTIPGFYDEAPEPFVPPETWLPRALVEFPAMLAEDFSRQDGFSVTPYLRQQLLAGIGPQGDFCFHANYAGEIAAREPHPSHAHLCCVRIGDAVQTLPASAVLRKPVGATVVAGEPLADVCARIEFYSWTDLENELGENLGWILSSFLRSRLIRGGTQGWLGAGSLLDIRFVPSSLYSAATHRPDGQLSWRLDCRAEAACVDERDGFVTFPPIPCEDSGPVLEAHGITWSFTPLSDYYLPATQRFPARRDRQGGRRRNVEAS